MRRGLHRMGRSCFALDDEDMLAPAHGKVGHTVERLTVKPSALLSRSLDFHELAARGVRDVHVDFGTRVVNVVQVEAHLTVDDPDAYGRDLIDQSGPCVVEC